MTLEEQFVRLVADVAHQHSRTFVTPLVATGESRKVQTRTVYSVGEAISQKGQDRDAKLGAGTNRNSGAGR